MKIERLIGPERVRRRPAVIFGSDGIEGVQHIVRNLMKLYVTEAKADRCKRLKVSQKDAMLEISGDDRGIYLGQDTGDDRYWQELFCELGAAPAYPAPYGDRLVLTAESHDILYGDQPKTANDWSCLELYAFQCACKTLEVRVNRDGISSTLRFCQGQNEGGIQNQPTTEPNGTVYRFEPDSEVFTETLIPEAFFLQALERFAIQVPGLCCVYENEAGRETVFFYEKGAQEYIERKHPGSVYRSWSMANGRERYNRAEYQARIEMAIGYTPNAGELRCFHNLEELPCGGTHVKELQKSLRDAFDLCYRKEISKLTFPEIAEHVTILISTYCAPQFTAWTNGARKGIQNRLITDMAQDLVDDAFGRYLYEYKDLYHGIVESALEKRNAK